MQIFPKAPIDICLLISLDWKWHSTVLENFPQYLKCKRILLFTSKLYILWKHLLQDTLLDFLARKKKFCLLILSWQVKL